MTVLETVTEVVQDHPEAVEDNLDGRKVRLVLSHLVALMCLQDIISVLARGVEVISSTILIICEILGSALTSVLVATLLGCFPKQGV